jgi:hypothetical protein
MGSSKKILKLSIILKLAVLLGVIGIVAALYTQMSPMYPIYQVWKYDEEVVLSDDFPMLEIIYPFADKVVIEGLTTNGSPIMIKLYETYFSDNPTATLENVTYIRDVFLVGAGSIHTSSSLFRLFRYDNQSVQISLSFRVWGTYISTDYITIGSPFPLLVVPLIIMVFNHWGQLPNRRGYAILILLLLSAVLIAPFIVYTYNGWGTLLRQDEVLDVQVYSFSLNTTDPIHEFNMSIDANSEAFIRIANLTTGNVTVAMTVTLNGNDTALNLSSMKTSSLGPLQFEFPAEGVSEVCVQLSRVAVDSVVNLTIQTVVDVWKPWKDRVAYDLSAAIGVFVMIVAFMVPNEEKLCDSDLPSES